MVYPLIRLTKSDDMEEYHSLDSQFFRINELRGNLLEKIIESAPAGATHYRVENQQGEPVALWQYEGDQIRIQYGCLLMNQKTVKRTAETLKQAEDFRKKLHKARIISDEKMREPMTI